jgi:hypothetical protein
MTIVLGLLLIAHGIAHVPGFVTDWRLAKLDGLPYRTTLVSGLDIGDAGMRVVGTLWMAVALGFVITAIGLFARTTWWPAAIVAVTLASTALCISALPQARVGLGVNVAVWVFLLLAWRLGWTFLSVGARL